MKIEFATATGIVTAEVNNPNEVGPAGHVYWDISLNRQRVFTVEASMGDLPMIIDDEFSSPVTHIEVVS